MVKKIKVKTNKENINDNKKKIYNGLYCTIYTLMSLLQSDNIYIDTDSIIFSEKDKQ